MGMSTGGGSGGVKNEINVTPLVDVCLVLLIIFMVVTPMLQRGKDVKLPAAKEQKKDDKKQGSDPLILSITPDKRVFIEQDEFPDMANFRSRLEREVASSPDRPILLKGDMTLAFGEVRKVMNIARQARAKAVQLGIEEIKEGQSAP